jgi:hypothetical protein
MGVDTGLHIPIGIDVEISPPPGNTSPDMGTVIPEIEDEHRFGLPESYDLFSEMVSLLRSDHEVHIALTINRDVKEIHLGDNPFLQKIIHPLLRLHNF